MRTGRTYDNMYDNIEKKEKIKKNKVENKHIIKMFIWMIIAIFMIYQSIKLLMYTLGKVDKEKIPR